MERVQVDLHLKINITACLTVISTVILLIFMPYGFKTLVEYNKNQTPTIVFFGGKTAMADWVNISANKYTAPFFKDTVHVPDLTVKASYFEIVCYVKENTYTYYWATNPLYFMNLKCKYGGLISNFPLGGEARKY